MRGHPVIILFAASLAVFSAGAHALPVPACTLSAPDISKEVHDKGAAELLQRLSQGHDGKPYDYTGFNQLVDCIWSGKKEWLDIAVPVIAASHPDSEDELADAVQNALAINPETTLSEPWSSYFTILDYVCSVSVDDYEAYGDGIAELNRRVNAVKDVSRPTLQAKVKECLEGFEKSKQELRRFFEVDKDSNSGTVPAAVNHGTAPPPFK